MNKRTCQRCGNEFLTNNGGRGQWQRFCSDACRQSTPTRTFGECIVEGCTGASTRLKGKYCEKHYYRLRRTGSLEVTHPQREHRGICTYPGCDRKDRGPRGYCDLHQGRIDRHGDPNIVLPSGRLSGSQHPMFKGEDVGYSGIHMRIKAERGSASNYPCVECGESASHWSYDHVDKAERMSPEGAYSIDLEHYQPRCVSCHKTYDLQFV